ncbi:3'-5' exonuclease [Salmonella enterica subsp. enterica]|nr:3'-5' exonuclease [Salmonella enterica subsp. enterica]MIF52450.1 3'-5' exonuclease [Salmonella enterica subsp. enterica]
MTVYLDTETTGLNTVSDALLEIAVVDDSGDTLLNTLIRPPEQVTAWPAAQRVHRITPEMVAGAPALAEIAPQIMAAVRDQDVIIYNAGFDAGFLGDLLAGARSVQCCMRAWAEHAGEWSDWHNDWRLHKLDAAAAAVCFTWPGEKHRAQADAQACRAVWQYLRDEAERRRVDLQHRDRRHAREADYALAEIRRREECRNDERNRQAGEFIAHWWVGLYGTRTHWCSALPVRQAEEAFAAVFFGKSLRLLALEEEFETVYRTTKSIPPQLHAINWFSAGKWYRDELRPCAAYVGKKQGWQLYHESECERIRELYPLRFSRPKLKNTEVLMTKTELLKAGFSRKQISALTPVAERQNGHSGEWYNLYKVMKGAAR